ncbi:acetylserotonin O-methyltransferase [Aurantimonas sp. VKM B-3413]|uniref:acetylserotonin O-methyltransferase n=1 Tax=Aurantimonas sp. VKM B-3413 TaxID=2779401 RepID=UPI001E4265FB|nr:acetylserotonin O-methyltransferase [Aurantimonas sp. VKM B-3413]MCB8839104.1 acetylserotonin O-methyltransferase [Aurantimonas sp. VKM B-3413]
MSTMSDSKTEPADPSASSGWADPMRAIRRYFRPWRQDWRMARNRRLADRSFQLRAARSWLTRPFARRSSRRLFDLTAGFVYSQILSAGVELRLFDRLAERPRSLSEVSFAIGLPEEASRRLLRASAALDLVEIDDDGNEPLYGLGPLGAALMANPGVQAMIRHHGVLYDDLRDPVALLKGETKDTALSRLWPYAAGRKPGQEGEAPAENTDFDVAAYTDLMSTSQDFVADEVIASYDFSWARKMLDVGGGDGRFLTKVAERHPQIELHLFDLPPVAGIARKRLADSRFGRRVSVHSGDFFEDPFPQDCDFVSLVRIIHDHDDDAAIRLLRKIRDGLAPGGVVMIAEPMAGNQHSAPVADAYFGFYLLAMGRGRARTPEEIGRLMNAAGLSRVREIPTSLPVAARIVLGEIPRRSVSFS